MSYLTLEQKLATLSKREQEVCALLLEGKTLMQSVPVLGCSHHTARNHLKHVFRKLGVHSQNELTAYLRNEIRVMQDIPEPAAIVKDLVDTFAIASKIKPDVLDAIARFIVNNYLVPVARGRHAGRPELSALAAQRIIDKINESDEIDPQQLASWVNAEI